MTDFIKGKILRSLKPKDAQGMLEWMALPETAGRFQFDFSSMDEAKVLNFIERSQDMSESLHLAVVDEDDTYLGTISLKHITERFSGEYAISMVPRAQGTGAAQEATEALLDHAFKELGLHRVFLNVRADNARAIRFYEKVGFTFEGTAREALPTTEGPCDLRWYSMLASEWD